MELNTFLTKLHQELEIESVDALTTDTDLQALDEWDSMTVMLLIGFVQEHFELKMTNDDILNFKNINDLINFIGKDKIS